ncbi:uncharacterized protein PG986_012974 [Apiospora aurea]|uniref:F-box domain-containing protein n=1 Tax=Apiospora aurea TaxID=335848 RepID=A0ABR1Q1H9_9PEZI
MKVTDQAPEAQQPGQLVPWRTVSHQPSSALMNLPLDVVKTIQHHLPAETAAYIGLTCRRGSCSLDSSGFGPPARAAAGAGAPAAWAIRYHRGAWDIWVTTNYQLGTCRRPDEWMWRCFVGSGSGGDDNRSGAGDAANCTTTRQQYLHGDHPPGAVIGRWDPARQFKTCIDETVFNPRILRRSVVDQVIDDGDLTSLLEQVSLGPGGDGESEDGHFRNEWSRRTLPFFVVHALREQSPHSTLGRVYRAAQAVSRIGRGGGSVTSDDEDEARTAQGDGGGLFSGREDDEGATADAGAGLRADVAIAVAWLGKTAYVQRLVAEEGLRFPHPLNEFGPNGGTDRGTGSVFPHPLRVAATQGSIQMTELVLSTLNEAPSSLPPGNGEEPESRTRDEYRDHAYGHVVLGTTPQHRRRAVLEWALALGDDDDDLFRHLLDKAKRSRAETDEGGGGGGGGGKEFRLVDHPESGGHRGLY